jgi:transporter family-2 protein
MTKTLVILIALLAGAGLALQVGLNTVLKNRVGHPIHAAFISFGTGTLALAVMAWFVRSDLAPPSHMARGPWWMWLGGLVGTVYVASSAALAYRIGSAGWLGLIITGQILASLFLDHFGLVGFDAHPVNGYRLAGAALLLLGVFLVLRF